MGFTLLELLVVVFIVAILATLLTLSTGIVQSDHSLQKESERLEVLLHLASDEAVLGAHELGLSFEPHAYLFSTLDPVRDVWTTDALGDALRERELGDDIALQLEINGREVILEKAEATDEPRSAKPQIFIYSSGDISPFTLRLRHATADAGYTLSVAANGSVELSGNEH